MRQTGTIPQAQAILSNAESAAVTALNLRAKSELTILSDLLSAIGRARVELEYAQVRMREIVDGDVR